MTLDLVDERALPEYLTEKPEVSGRKPDYCLPPGVLIATDRPEALATLRLRRQVSQHYRVLATCKSSGVVETTLQLAPDVVVVDTLGSAAGFQVCKQLRHHERTRQVPILYLATSRKKESGLTALSAGANDLLVRPFAAGELVLRLNHLVAISQYQANLLSAVAQLQASEARMYETARLATLGMTAGTIIHDIANPLTRARNAVCELLHHTDRMPEDLRQETEKLIYGMEQDLALASGIIEDTRLLGRTPNPFEWVSLLGSVNQCLRLLHHDIDKQVSMVVSISPGQLVYAQRHKLLQVLINLVKNAAQALAQGAQASQATICITGSETGSKSIISVRDNGPGIPNANLASIFEPWFTTKTSGLGLGLAICSKFMAEMGGTISVGSIPGQYCEFTLELPLKASGEVTARD